MASSSASGTISDTIDLTGSGNEEQPRSTTLLTGKNCYVFNMTFVPEKSILVATSGHCHIHVYDLHTTTGAPRTTFNEHKKEANDVAQLESDIVASVGEDKMLLSWRAATGELVDKWEHSNPLMRVKKLGKDRLVVSDWSRTIVVLEHKSGSNFQQVQLVKNAHSFGITDFILFRDNFVLSFNTLANDPVKLWNTTSFAPLAAFRPGGTVSSAAVSDKHILLASIAGHVYAHRNSEGYPLDFTIRLGGKGINKVVFVSEDVVAVSGAGGILYFVSLSAKSILSKMKMRCNVASIVVLNDGRLALGGTSDNRSGYCAFIEPPESVRKIVAKGAATLYPDSCRDISRTGPSPHTETTGHGSQLEMWEEIGVYKDSVRTLKCNEVAAMLAAFLVDYEPQFTEQFKKYKNVLVEHFRKSCALGVTFTDCDEKDREKLPDAVMEALAEVLDEGSFTRMKKKVEMFVGLSVVVRKKDTHEEEDC